MKVYQSIIINIANSKVLAEKSYDYYGPIASAKGETPSPSVSPAGKIIKKLQDPIIAAAKDLILNPNATGAATDRLVQKSTQGINNAFAARGLSGSGIAIRGAQEAANDIRLGDINSQRQGIIGLLGAGSGSPTFGPAAQPKGIFGLK